MKSHKFFFTQLYKQNEKKIKGAKRTKVTTEITFPSRIPSIRKKKKIPNSLGPWQLGGLQGHARHLCRRLSRRGCSHRTPLGKHPLPAWPRRLVRLQAPFNGSTSPRVLPSRGRRPLASRLFLVTFPLLEAWGPSPLAMELQIHAD